MFTKKIFYLSSFIGGIFKIYRKKMQILLSDSTVVYFITVFTMGSSII